MDDISYTSITSSGIMHDAANMLTELIWLNRDIQTGERPWQGANGREWGGMVSCIKKLMRDFEIDQNQLAFYIYHCRPVNIKGIEFAKMAVVAKKLFKRYELSDLVRMYSERRQELKSTFVDNLQYKKQKPKSLVDFLKELENGKKE